MKRVGYFRYFLFFVLFAAIGACFAETMNDLQSRFLDLPRDSQRLTGPLFWLHGDESAEQLEDYVQKVSEGGNGCFTAESRPHNDWLGEGWYRDLEICLAAAKKHDLKMWIFDEKWWPSGEVGGMVPKEYGSKYMEAQAVEVQAGEHISHTIGTNKLIAALAGKVSDGGVDGDSLVDLTGNVKDGVLHWQAPAGQWKVMVFTWRYSTWRNGHVLVDGASQDAVDWYIETVYQPHYDRFKDDFGTWIPGFFYDEPETYGDWGTEVIPLLKERQVDWKKALVAWKFRLAQDQAAAKYQYQDAFAETWGRTLFGGISEWCRDHGVISIGHFLEHGNEYLSRRVCAGNMFQLQKYSDMGGIDAVFDQFIMGKRVAANPPTWQTPKLGSSISHVYGKQDDISMVEIFGARGQNLTYPEMKWWTNHMHVSGINFHIPHAFNPRSPYDTDCPPYFYNSGHEPRWPLYQVYADYTSRLSTMLHGGRHVCPVALLFVGNSVHVGQAVLPEQISAALQDALYDCDWMPYEVFENDVELDRDQMKLYKERYRVLIVPPVEVIPYETLAKVHQFFKSGGTVVGYGFLPSKPADIGKTSDQIHQLCDAIWGHARPGLQVCKTSTAGGRSYFLDTEPTRQQIQQVLAEDAGLHPTLEVLEGETDGWLHVLHRVKDDRDIFFICNQNTDDESRAFRFRIQADGFPEYWDPMRGEVCSVPFKRKGDHVELSLTLEPLESALLVFAENQRKLPSLLDTKSVSPVKVIEVTKKRVKTAQTETLTIDRGKLSDCIWIWHPDQDALVSAPAGRCYFRGVLNIPSKQKVSAARFIGTADNVMSLFVNGSEVNADSTVMSQWAQVADLDITSFMKQGRNTIGISVLNATDEPSPAGLIGKLELSMEDGTSRTVLIDTTWKTACHLEQGWQKAEFDDSKWLHARSHAAYGAGPWGAPGRGALTLSPIAQADPFEGVFKIARKDRSKRVVLEMGQIAPEEAGRVSVNGNFVGGCIGKPLVMDLTEYVKQGTNTLRIEPFSPESVKVKIYSN